MKRGIAVALLLMVGSVSARPIVVGSKNFGESYMLAEAAAQLLEYRGYDVERRLGLNGTRIIFTALSNGAVDFYPEYTGTISEVILKDPERKSLPDIRAALAKRGFLLLDPLGFNNAYALATSEVASRRYGLTKISDLRNAPPLRIALPHEFLNRADGWPGLKAFYGLDLQADGIDHGLVYEAINSDKVDLIAVYTTDGEIERSHLVVLEDDEHFFPGYRAAYLARDDLDPDVLEILGTLSGRIDDHRMREMNLAVLDPATSYADVAADFLREEGLVGEDAARSGMIDDLLENTRRHLKLTAIALGLAILAGVGVATLVHPHRRLSEAFLYFAGLLQTVPSIALLALMIPLVGVGQVPAIIALFLYSLLPIARSTITAMRAIPPGYRQVAAAMAMTRFQEMRYVLMPLAMPHVIAGVRTAAVICIGTATLAAFIGAGGLGDPIVTGLALNDSGLILQGAIPAAGLAIFTELMFGAVERALVVPHMRSTYRRS